ncbi:Fic family protein [[Acholeplasma] multilocale]|uniref:Fic family protein n=1 Tax=[Acholeplasma] multilocale TaxID=264638 RepID=UPI00244DA6CA|nr:Fic family protein [[Acholeplasma] multilocale]
MENYMKYWRDECGYNSNLLENPKLEKEKYLHYVNNSYYSLLILDKAKDWRQWYEMGEEEKLELYTELEITNYRRTIFHLEREIFEKDVLVTQKDILDLSRILLAGMDYTFIAKEFVPGFASYLDKKTHQFTKMSEVGKYRTINISKGEIHFLNYRLIEGYITTILNNYNKVISNPKINIIDKFNAVILFHINFELIHPFVDGNGRIGRMVMDAMLMHLGLIPLNINGTKYHKMYLDTFNKVLVPKQKEWDYKILDSLPKKVYENFQEMYLQELGQLSKLGLLKSVLEKEKFDNTIELINELTKN